VRLLHFGLLTLLIHSSAYAQASISCLEWCRKCDLKPGCTTDCLLQNQPMHARSCVTKSETSAQSEATGMPCYDWCSVCEPNDTACPRRCDKQGQPFMTRACPPSEVLPDQQLR
jgi:hypothetical protein